MGFGILFFGYFAMYAFALSQAYFFADVIGAAVTLYALIKLSDYSRHFRSAAIAVLGFLAVSLVNVASLFFDLYPMGEGAIWTAGQLLKLAAGCVFHVFLLLGMKVQAERAGIFTLRRKSVRNLIATSLYYSVAVPAVFFVPRLELQAANSVNLAILLYWGLCLILNLALIYGCFSMIVSEDADMTRKKRSKIGFLNAMSDKFDELDDKKNEYRRTSMKMALDEADRLRAEKEKKKQNKRK